MRTPVEVKHAFRPVPVNQVQKMAIMHTESLFEQAALEIMDKVPECADRTHAIRLLLDSKMWCIQAISHDPALATVPDKTKK